MDFETGGDLIALKELLQGTEPQPSEWSNPSMEADEYARWNGLTIDSRFDPWPRLVNNDMQISATVNDVETGSLFEIAFLEECLFRTIIPTPEQWQLPASSFLLVQKACKEQNQREVTELMREVCLSEVSERKKLKLEVPALRSDHNTDCRQLARAMEEFKKVRLPDHDVLLFPEKPGDGGLAFTKAAREADEVLMKKLRAEPLEMKRESMVFLMQSLKADWTESDHHDVLESFSTYNGVGAREHLTPPLSPLLEPLSDYFIPDDEDCEIPEPSEAGSMLSADIEAAEREIFEDDLNFWSSVATGEPPAPDSYDDLDIPQLIRAGELATESPFASPRPLPRGTKVEVPLFIPENESEWKHPKSRVLEPEDLAKARAFIQSSDPLSGAADVLEQEFVDFITAKAEFLMRSAEQEKLQPLDATARVPVPVLDFSIPMPEWGMRPLKSADMFEWILARAEVNLPKSKWPEKRALIDKMVWTPVTHRDRNVLVSESIEADLVALGSFLARPTEVVTSLACLKERSRWKLRRPLDDDDSEIEIEDAPASPIRAPKLGSQQRRNTNRKNRTTHPGIRPDSPHNMKVTTLHDIRPGGLQSTKARQSMAEPSPPSKGKKRTLDEMLQQKRSSSTANGTAAGSRAAKTTEPSTLGSASLLQGFMSEYTNIKPLVDNFLEMHTRKKAKMAHSHYFESSSDSAATPPISTAQPFIDLTATPPPPPVEPIPAIAPDFAPPSIPPRVIVSSTISRQITNLIKSYIPGINILDRDYNKSSPPGWFPGIRSPNADEADIIISPATGILLTTMVKLRQKPLPGMTGQVIFRHIVENVALRYETLIVLVSEGNKSSETMIPLSQSDAKALAEFQGYVAALETDVRLSYVGGGNETLAKWIAAAICKHAPEAFPVQDLLLPVETGWELFLRRAGMNVYAAQATLGVLKVPDGEPAVGGARFYGLPLFVMMEPHERLTALEDPLGGRKVLDRVSEALDEPWGQHAIGQVREAAAGPETFLGGF
ncbi:hypothetical protein B0T16DRAFT_380749 [Cercophora newfieldiana]|uniref:Uncharacterized protein n=1 Tax=Cercophora newfieldiana TaxID=92897 RepID=A0AA40CLE0_9PEZI|nr:hypothetical protein B0T16DRAFT_380749 [Cercophora newfieldiana]